MAYSRAPVPGPGDSQCAENLQWHGAAGSLEVTDTSVTFNRASGSATSTACCGCREVAHAWPIADCVGASLSSKAKQHAVLLHTCPGKRDKNGKVSRKHVSVGPFLCRRDEDAQQLVQLVRRKVQSRSQVCEQGKQVWVISNPVSGKGKTAHIAEDVATLLASTGMQVVMESTAYASHATQMVAALDPAQVGCIAAVGGDGTFHEVVQGIAQHAHAEQVSQIPLCLVPGGSGNGISATCNLWTPATAAHAIVHGQVKHFDAATVVQPQSGTHMLSVLGVQYGMLANLDIDTEHLRSLLGGERFTYGAVREILRFKAYDAKLAWVTESDQGRAEQATSKGDQSGHRWPDAPLLNAAVQHSSGEDLTLSDGWTQEDTSVRFMNLAGPSWAALDYHLNPWGTLDDGVWELATDVSRSRVQSLKMLLSTQSGAHEKSGMFDVKRVVAFAIMPKSMSTYLTVDGEKVACEPLLAQVHKGLLRVVVAPGQGDMTA